MKKLFSFILSLIFAALSSFFPGFINDGPGITTGDWLTLLVTEFGMETDEYSDVPYYAGIDATNDYFKYVQISYEWGIIDSSDEIDTDAFVTNAFVKKTLTNAVKGTDLAGIDFSTNKRKATLEAAVRILAAVKDRWANQEFEEKAEVVADNGVADLSGIPYEVNGNILVYNAADFKLAVGQKFIAGVNAANLSGAAYKVVDVSVSDGKAYVTVEALPLEDAVSEIDFAGSVVPDLKKAKVTDYKGDVIQEAQLGADAVTAEGTNAIKDLLNDAIGSAKDAITDFLENPEISFSVGGIDIDASYTKAAGRVDIGIGGQVADNVRLQKYFSLTNIKIDAKYDANLARLKINEAYVIMNYDLVETTVLDGSYAGSVVPQQAADSTADFLTKVKTALGSLALVDGNKINVNIFTFDIPIGSTGLTIEMNIYLSINAYGRIEIIVSSNQTKGFEIINNKGRFINESTIYDRIYNISGDFKILLGINLSLTFMTYKIIDVEVEAGIGAYVITKVFNVLTGEKSEVNIPIDIAVETTTGLSYLADLRFCANIELYGILKISVGEKSILSAIGLKKTWDIYNKGNATFAILHIENEGIVDQCAYV